VVVDEKTCFSTFILQGHSNPAEMHAFALNFFAQVFKNLPFSLHQNDYRFNNKKVGGNAQYFTKDRALHHTSFLFDWNKERMDLLKMPPKMPEYREQRTHEEFLTPLKEFFNTPKDLLDRMATILQEMFEVVEVNYEDLLPMLQKKYRRSLMML
jgi:lipoate-protein ligase A